MSNHAHNLEAHWKVERGANELLGDKPAFSLAHEHDIEDTTCEFSPGKVRFSDGFSCVAKTNTNSHSSSLSPSPLLSLAGGGLHLCGGRVCPRWSSHPAPDTAGAGE